MLRRFAVGAAQHDELTVWIPQPQLAVARRWVHVDVFDDLGPERSSAVDGCIEIAELEPDQDTVTVSPVVSTHEVRVVLRVPGVELEHQRAVHEQPVVQVVVVRRH